MSLCRDLVYLLLGMMVMFRFLVFLRNFSLACAASCPLSQISAAADASARRLPL
jgi:hypothetical protein